MKNSNKFTNKATKSVIKFTDSEGLKHFINGTASRSNEPFLKDKEYLDIMFEHGLGTDSLYGYLKTLGFNDVTLESIFTMFNIAIKYDQANGDSYWTEVMFLFLLYQENLSEQNIWIINSDTKLQTKVQSFQDIIDVIVPGFKMLIIK